MANYMMDKHKKVCSMCGNDFFDKSGNMTMCGSCQTAEDPQMMKDRMMQEKIGPWPDVGNGSMEMENESMDQMDSMESM